jgi:hypothetical protein
LTADKPTPPHLLAERGQVERLVHVPALPCHATGDAGRHLDLDVLAQIRVAGDALRAGTAEHREAGDHVIAGLDVSHAFADRLDDTGRLMAEHARCRMRVEPLDEMQIAVAQAGKGRAQ